MRFGGGEGVTGAEVENALKNRSFNSFPFNFFCFARNFAKYPRSSFPSPSSSLSSFPLQPPTLFSIETSPDAFSRTSDGVMHAPHWEFMAWQ